MIMKRPVNPPVMIPLGITYGASPDFGGDDVWIGKVRAVFKAFVFEPELNSLGAKNQTGRAERPTRWEARSQDGEVGFIVLKGSTNCEK